MSSNEDSPSYQRRQALREADAGNIIRVLDSYPLHKYFDLSQRLLDAFQKAVDHRQMDEAYVYGMRFATFSIESLPKHKDWRTGSIYNKQKRRNAQQVDKVLGIMEIIKQRMDAEELVRHERTKAEEEERQKQIREKELQSRLEEKKKQEQHRQKLAEKNKSIEQSAMNKLMAMQQSISSSKVKEHKVKEHKVKEQKIKEHDSSIRQSTKAHVDHEKQEQPIPPKEEIKTPKAKPPLPSKETEVSSSSNQVLEIAPVPATTPSKENNTIMRKMTPRTSKEQRTIDMLQEAIRAQEKRLDEIENTQIPALVRLAKQYLQEQEVNRQAALKCVAHKRSLERQVDVIKAAIFNMETQMFMLENAMEDRQVQKALAEAAQAMKGLQESVGIDETSTTDLADLTATLPVTTLDLQDNDEELLEELQEWIAPSESEIKKTKQEDLSHMTMPAVPETSIGAKTEASGSNTSSIEKLLKAVLG